jgi:hypothetical protein
VAALTAALTGGNERMCLGTLSAALVGDLVLGANRRLFECWMGEQIGEHWVERMLACFPDQIPRQQVNTTKNLAFSMTSILMLGVTNWCQTDSSARWRQRSS